VLTDAPRGTPSGCQLPGGPSLKINLQAPNTVSPGFWLILLHQISDIDYAPIYTYLSLMISSIRGWLADGAHPTVLCSYQLELHSVTELQIQVKELLFDHRYLSKVDDDKKS